MATKTRKTGTGRSAIEAAPPPIEAARAEVKKAAAAVADAPAKTVKKAVKVAAPAAKAAEPVAKSVTKTVETATKASLDTADTAADATVKTVAAATEVPVAAAKAAADVTETVVASTPVPDVPSAADAVVSATDTVANIVQEEVKTMASKFETPKTTAEFADKAQTAMQKSGQYAADFADFGKGNVEAMVESTRIAAKGAEEIFKYSTDYGRQTIEKANETAKRFASVKSPVEFFQLQTEVSKSFVEAIVAEGSKFTENYLKLVSETVQPLSNRFAVATDKVKAAA